MAAEPVSAGLPRTNQSRSAQRDLLELAVGYGLILATVWTANPTQRVLYWLAFAWIVATSWARHDGWTALGLGRKGLLQSLWIVGAALVLSAIAIFIAWQTHSLHRLHGRTPILLHGWGYIVWSVMQQFLLQSYFLLRLLRLLPGKAAPIVAAAGIFALAHLPNPILTPVTLVWGAVSCVLFLRYRNIYALGVAHGILGLCVAVTVPNSLHHHMRVGLGYLRYHPRWQDRRQPIGRNPDSLPNNSRNARHFLCRHPERSERPLYLVVASSLRRHPERSEGPLYFVVACSYSVASSHFVDPANHRSQSDHRVSTDAWVIADAPTRRS